MHGVYRQNTYIEEPQWDVWVNGEFIGSTNTLGEANQLFSFYEQKALK